MTAETDDRDRENGHVRSLEARRAAPWTFLFLIGAALIAVPLFGFSPFVNAISIGIQGVFVVYFVRHFAFAISALRTAPTVLGASDADTGFRPTVTVMVPCKNEELVLDALISSLFSFDYPDDRIEFIVIDDGSTDRTGEMLDRAAAADPRLRALHRAEGAPGGKSAALNEGLAFARGEIILTFDGDHRPRPDVVWRLMRHFENPAVGAVQGRCEIRNAHDTAITELIAIDYFAGYLANEYGRQALYELPAYGGANCAVRASSLRKIGGWNEDSVTEDTDLTLRLILRGERVRYDPTAVDEEEAVQTLPRYWRQRYRWARGHQQVWRDYRKDVVKSRVLTVGQKIESILFLLVFHVPIVAAAGIVVLVLWLAGLVHPIDPLDVYVLWALLFLGPLSELGSGLLISQSDRWSAFAIALFLPLYLVSSALCTKAWLDALLGRSYTWRKTARAVSVATP